VFVSRLQQVLGCGLMKSRLICKFFVAANLLARSLLELLPRFPGLCSLPPAEVEMMNEFGHHKPVLESRNALEKDVT